MTLPRAIETDQRSTGEGEIQAWLAGGSRTGTFAFWDTTINVPERFASKWSDNGTSGSFEVYRTISRVPAAATQATTSPAQIRTIASLRLEKLINEERDASHIDDDCIAFADASVRDAFTLIRRHNLS